MSLLFRSRASFFVIFMTLIFMGTYFLVMNRAQRSTINTLIVEETKTQGQDSLNAYWFLRACYASALHLPSENYSWQFQIESLRDPQFDNLKKNFDDAEERRLVVDEEFVDEFDLEEGEGQLHHHQQQVVN